MSEDILARIDEIREMSGGESEHLSMLQVSDSHDLSPSFPPSFPDPITHVLINK